MGYAYRSKPVEKLTTKTVNGLTQQQVEIFGNHNRKGYFEMIMHADESTSYWGVWVAGAMPGVTASVAMLLGGLLTLSLL